MTYAQKVIDWLTEHPDSRLAEIQEGANLPPCFAGSYLRYLTRNGTLVRTGQKEMWRYRVAEKLDHPPAQSNGIPADKRVLIECPHCAGIFELKAVPNREAAGKP